MKENKGQPARRLSPMLLQIPVFFGFFTMIRSGELRGANFLWVADLSQPDTLFFVGGFPLQPAAVDHGATMLWRRA